jgi:hypothetical protein
MGFSDDADATAVGVETLGVVFPIFPLSVNWILSRRHVGRCWDACCRFSWIVHVFLMLRLVGNETLIKRRGETCRFTRIICRVFPTFLAAWVGFPCRRSERSNLITRRRFACVPWSVFLILLFVWFWIDAEITRVTMPGFVFVNHVEYFLSASLGLIWNCESAARRKASFCKNRVLFSSIASCSLVWFS